MRRRSLLLTGPGRLEWVEEELPSLQPDELLIQTEAGAISIGAELPQYRGTARSSAPAYYPHMTGHQNDEEKKPPRCSSSVVLRRREENKGALLL